jgi:hypothetical protein
MIRLASDWYCFIAPLYAAARQHPVVSHDGTPACAGLTSNPRSHLDPVREGRFLGVSSRLAPAEVRDGRGAFSKGETR